LVKKSKNSSVSAVVLSSANHSIKLELINENALLVVRKILEAGFDAYLVGGCVRDLLLDLKPKDFDVSTSATPEEIKKIFSNCRLIGRRFRLAHITFRHQLIEVATFRGNSEDILDEHVTTEGRILRDNVYGSIEEDAARRDFTVNALYYDVANQSVMDFGVGIKDLSRKLISIIGVAEVRFREDPVRMLRAIRFAAKLDFEIEPATKSAIHDFGSLLDNISPSRLFDETKKIFLSGQALKCYLLLHEYNLFTCLFPQTAKRLMGKEESLESDRNMLTIAMNNTDSRIQQSKPVTPAFLYAVLLWPEVRAQAFQLQKRKSMSAKQALEIAGSEVASLQAKRTSLPRRFSQPMREIWSMQPWFEQRSKQRISRLLSHARFRAAYDFLLLRAEVGQAEESLATWWTEIQESDEYQEILSKKGHYLKSKHAKMNSRRPRSHHQKKSSY